MSDGWRRLITRIQWISIGFLESTMIKQAACDAPMRIRKIQSFPSDAKFDKDPWLNAFGIQVDMRLVDFDTRILAPPKLQYGAGNRPGESVVMTRKGVWCLEGQSSTFHPVNGFGLLVAGRRRFHGAVCSSSASQKYLLQRLWNRIPEWPYRVEAAGKEYELIIAILSQMSTQYFSEVQVQLWLIIQVVLMKSIMDVTQKGKMQTAQNLALKMNMKMGGINSKVLVDEDSQCGGRSAEQGMIQPALRCAIPMFPEVISKFPTGQRGGSSRGSELLESWSPREHHEFDRFLQRKDTVGNEEMPGPRFPCLVLDFMDKSLRDLLRDAKKEKRYLEVDQIQKLAFQLLRGLNYLHHVKNLVHLDIKPKNLLVNSTDLLKITDMAGVKGQSQSELTFREKYGMRMSVRGERTEQLSENCML